jgi:hypothetical protein
LLLLDEFAKRPDKKSPESGALQAQIFKVRLFGHTLVEAVKNCPNGAWASPDLRWSN